ncbi:type II toxin-antitoxin system PemK/MazF family toxin [Clostridium perfringens]|uniref:type II toxin-antitoxin system PemK/MazF family toxin n=1 Tax=Clostridium perfringens TaxID=1502 RepID=UPI0039E740E6
MARKIDTRFKRGDVLLIDLGQEVKGSEQKGKRPCVVISNNRGNGFSPVLTVLSITSQQKAAIPTHVEIEKSLENGLTYDKSLVLAEQVRTISKERVIRKFGTLSEDDMQKVDKAIMKSLFN